LGLVLLVATPCPRTYLTQYITTTYLTQYIATTYLTQYITAVYSPGGRRVLARYQSSTGGITLK